jgi:small GTP-binding protein
MNKENSKDKERGKKENLDTCQLIIVGDSIVGKTSILVQYTENKFNDNIISTVGIDYYLKTENINGSNVQVKIWDTAGQERYQAQTNAFFKNAEGVILVYDVTNTETFLNLKNWINSINSNTRDSNLKKIIIGNKIDLKREVNKEEAVDFAKENGIPYYEVSAKLNTNINDSIKSLIEEVVKTPEYQQRKKLKGKKLDDIPDNKGDKKKSNDCCR